MRCIWLLVILSSTAPPAGAPVDKGPSIAQPPAEIMRQLATLNDMDRQAWAKAISQRLYRASLVVLKGNEVARLYAYNKRAMEEVAANGPQAPQALEALLKELEQLEPLALERIAAQFRARINQALSDKPTEQEKRRTALDNAMTAWKDAGSPPSQRGELIYWIVQAERNTAIGYTRPLPEIPQFHREAAAPGLPSGAGSAPAAPAQSPSPPPPTTPANPQTPSTPKTPPSSAVPVESADLAA